MHQTNRLAETPLGDRTRLAEVLVEHHRHTVAVYGFVKDSLTAPQAEERQTEAIEHVRLLDICADWLELLEPRLEIRVRNVLNGYLEEVAKVSRVVRLQTPLLDTDSDRLTARLEDVLRALEIPADGAVSVDKRHSDTTV